jgi:hypothetical protein
MPGLCGVKERELIGLVVTHPFREEHEKDGAQNIYG